MEVFAERRKKDVNELCLHLGIRVASNDTLSFCLD